MRTAPRSQAPRGRSSRSRRWSTIRSIRFSSKPSRRSCRSSWSRMFPPRRRVGFVEVRNRGIAADRVRAWPAGRVAAAGSAGADRRRCSRPLTTRTRGCASKRSTRSATIARPPLAADAEQLPDQGARSLRSGDPRRRGARRGTAAGQGRGRRADQGGQRLERRRALRGDASARHVARRARRRALDRAARSTTARARVRGRRSMRSRASRIASSVPIFTARLTDRDPYLRRAAAEGLGRAGDRRR